MAIQKGKEKIDEVRLIVSDEVKAAIDRSFKLEKASS